MRLLNAQEIAAKRNQDTHLFVTRYNRMIEEFETKKKELRTLEANLEKLKGELLTYINKLYEH